ncbi:MAG: virulence RhuM family protein [Candidatus Symbiothrix sp.]|nr:virulence RhuM family protein [Candidatus Symbiothrix sp.]
MTDKNEIVLYQPDNSVNLEVRLENETVWLNRQQLAILFDRNVKTIGKHINNALKEELAEFPVVANFATTAKDGKIYQVDYYSLDMILSVGYRVKSSRGVQFRIWANSVLKDYILRGYAISQRFERLEYRMTETEKKIDFFVKTALPPVEDVFYDGQIFDAYKFVAELIKRAKKSIVLIDNYVDESVLVMLTKRNAGVDVTIYTAKISAQLQLDLTKHNAQYPPITITEKVNIHDRFLLIDNEIYHIGASLKDLGKKLFAFTKMGMKAAELMRNIGKV